MNGFRERKKKAWRVVGLAVGWTLTVGCAWCCCSFRPGHSLLSPRADPPERRKPLARRLLRRLREKPAHPPGDERAEKAGISSTWGRTTIPPIDSPKS